MRLCLPIGLFLLVVSMLQPPSFAAQLKVVATVTDLGWIAQEVGGQDVEVTVLCPGPMDPHHLPAKPSLARKLGKADLLVYNGLELEIGWLPVLMEAARNPRIKPGSPGELDCSEVVAGILEIPSKTLSRSEGDIHPLGNPHYLADPRLGVDVGRFMAARMAELAPEAASRFAQRAEALAELIESRLPVWQQLAAAAVSRPIVVHTKQWEYLAAWLGLEIIGVIEHRPGISASPRHVNQIIARGREQGSVLVMAATWNHIDASRNAAERMGAPLLVLPAAVGAVEGVDSYPALFDTICGRLGAAAQGEHE